jgi:hypothetical protein
MVAQEKPPAGVIAIQDRGQHSLVLSLQPIGSEPRTSVSGLPDFCPGLAVFAHAGS